MTFSDICIVGTWTKHVALFRKEFPGITVIPTDDAKRRRLGDFKRYILWTNWVSHGLIEQIQAQIGKDPVKLRLCTGGTSKVKMLIRKIMATEDG